MSKAQERKLLLDEMLREFRPRCLKALEDMDPTRMVTQTAAWDGHFIQILMILEPDSRITRVEDD